MDDEWNQSELKQILSWNDTFLPFSHSNNDWNPHFILIPVFFQITQQLEGICLQVIGTVLQQHVLGKQDWFHWFFHILPARDTKALSVYLY